MADFFDEEAIVSEGSDDEEVRHELQKHKKSKHLKRNVESDEEEEEEEEDDEAIREEMKDLINDEEEDEADSEDDIGRGHKRSRDEDELEEDLEDDDYDLIEENLGRRIQRKKKFRRVRRLEDDDDEEGENDNINDREAIANELFDDDNDQPQPSNRERPQVDDRFAEIGSESEDEDDFFVDDNDQPIARQRIKKGQHFDHAVLKAQDVFGVDFDFNEVENYDENGDFDEEDDYSEDAAAQEGEGRKKKGRAAKKSIFELYEPSELERSHLTEMDNEIRNNDLPERYQLRAVPVTGAEQSEVQEESEWIYHNLYEMPTISKQDKSSSSMRYPLGGIKPKSVIASIQQVVHFLRNHLQEVPFIAFYRKEYYMPDLNINDLWLIYRWDEKWCQLQERKKNLLKLLEDMKEYQLNLIMKNHDQPLPENFRRITERDIKKVFAIQSIEEFTDCYLHFQLYYNQDIAEMKKFIIEQKLIAKQKKRQQQQYNSENPEENAEREEEEDDENEILQMSERINTLRLSKKKDAYTSCQQFRIGQVVDKFGLTPEQFGEHISEGYARHEVEQVETTPTDTANEFISKRFDSVDKVLQAATFMLGRQISVDPLVRKTVRQIFYERAKVNARPTKRGKKEIDEMHPCYPFKYLINKPISSFVEDQFLQLYSAKKEGLMEMDIYIDDSTSTMLNTKQQNSYLDEIKYLFHKDEFSHSVQSWNDQRTKALEVAFYKYLYPYFVKEITTKLLSESYFTIIQACAKTLSSYLSVSPYRFDAEKFMAEDDDGEFGTHNGLRILGIAFTPGNEEASFGALIDGDGEITDYIKLEHFMLKRTEGFATEKDKAFRQKDCEKLKRFILQKKPHVIALGCDTIVTRDVMAELQTLINELHEMEHFPRIPVEYVDCELSNVFMNSKRALADFHSYPAKLRQAISLARRLQDPLIEFAQLCTPDDEILCLKYHPLQDRVPRDELLNALLCEFVNRVNEVGVDVNRCLVHSHTAPLIQFVGGLGPRKGAFLLRTLKKQQTALLETRTQLIQTCNIGKVVFINCAGFIRIDTTTLADSGTETYIEVLDSTRVHPEAYDWARKMAVDALDYDEDNDTNPAQALEEIIDNPEKLRDLDLDEFAKELKRQGFGLRKQTLYDIRTELTHRYQDKRREYTSATEKEIFTMLTGESEETLYYGKLVQVRVTGIFRRKPKSEQVDQAQPIRMETGLWKCPFCSKEDFSELGEVWNHFDTNQCPGQAFGVRVKLDNGLTGLIPIKYLSDKEVTDPLTRVKPGMSIYCRILKVILERFSLELTCRSSDLTNLNKFKLVKDNNYDYELEDKDTRKEEDVKKRNSKQRTYMKRIIVHPSFHNIDFRQAEKLLNESNQGDCIIRPSSKGNNHLTLSWKVHNGIHQHVDIREEGKSNVFSLGQQLFIANEQYEDLDEIIARYVQPMAGLTRDLISFKYFRDLNADTVAAERVLNEEKQKAPSRIPYIISASKALPGKFLLSYLPNAKAFHEFVTVTPDGFRYRNNIFKSLNALFKWFKAHFNDRSTIPQTPTLKTPASASPYMPQRTPIAQTSPFIGNTSAKQSFVPTPNINPQALQRAAAAMPNHIFNSLSQVAGQTTPSFNANTFGQSPAVPGGFAIPARPGVYPPAGGGGGGGPLHSFPASIIPPGGPMPPPPPPVLDRPGSRSGNQWAEMIQKDWQQPSPGGRRSGNTPLKPRTPVYATPGASSQMSISPAQEETPNIRGDQTPLVDEWNY